MSKYAPPRSDGLKPWLVTRREWGHSMDSIVYAESAAQAKYKVIGRRRYVTATVRRATHEEVAAHG